MPETATNGRRVTRARGYGDERHRAGAARTAALVMVLATVTLASSSSRGAGFAVPEQSISNLGNAFAGGAASAEDASTVWHNPAGMTRQPQQGQFLGIANLLVPSAKFSNGGSAVNPAFTGGVAVPLPGGTTGDSGGPAFVPAGYFTKGITEKLYVGFGINAPFGLTTEYDDGWVGRYHALDSELKVYNFNPSLAYRFDKLSVGVGLNVQYADARISNALDKAGICLGALTPMFGAGAGTVCTGAGLPPAAIGSGTADGELALEADSWGVGFNAGVLYEFSKATRVGLHFRSRIRHDLEGRANFSNTADLAGLLGAGRFTTQGGAAALELPESLSASVHHTLVNGLALMGDVTWTRWSRFNELRVVFDGGQPTSVTPADWNDSFRISVGATYPVSWGALRAGFSYDEVAIPNASLRTPRIPGDDRYWITFGFTYEPSKNVQIDAAYAHVFVGDVPINNAEVATGHVLRGTFASDADVLSVQMSYRFD